MTEVADEVLDAPAALAEFNPVQKGLAELRHELAGVQFDVTTTAGDKAARAARAKCVTIRTSAKKVYEGWNAPMLEKQRAMRALVTTITAEVEKIELPIDAQIKAEEQRRAEIKAAKEAAELARQQAIQERLDHIRDFATSAAGLSSAKIAAMRETLAEFPLTTELYEHRAGEAMQLHAEVVAKLDQMHAAALAQEQEAARLAAERAELERQRQEQEAAAQRQREAEAAQLAKERAELEEQQRQLQAARDEENARQEAARAEQARKDAEAAAALKRQQDEIDRQRREFEAQQEAARRAEQEKEEAAAREQQEKEAAARAEAERAERARQEEAARRERENFEKVGPGATAIAHAVAESFDVDVQVAVAWLKEFDAASVEQITE
ncbi:hypothetical protein KDH83_28660 [Achromobacter sp. Marseille-Q0513]|uniref:hypothetical protein n=1 Tax=Achromobacter sp. Marseille-Q0513 TaxID=2829161 RepID=UPI001B95EAE4|nr:hypothetical protein [Achromobacter sp. Marseille-Q0513]MBR8657295.1 hypothetical protein [Achromobacter sp. Marseille-Q0513]